MQKGFLKTSLEGRPNSCSSVTLYMTSDDNVCSSEEGLENTELNGQLRSELAESYCFFSKDT